MGAAFSGKKKNTFFFNSELWESVGKAYPVSQVTQTLLQSGASVAWSLTEDT